MTRSDTTDWRRVLRLARAPQLWGGWRPKLIAIFAWLVAAAPSLAALSPHHHDAAAPMVGVQLLLMLTYLLYAMTSVLNASWRRLPVSDLERRTAVWINLCAVPLLFCLTIWLVGVALAFGFHHPAEVRGLTAILGLQGLVMGSFSFAVLLLASWPETLSWFQMVSRRRIGDWLIWALFGGIVVFAATWRPQPERLAANAWWLASGALGLGLVTLPVARTWARIDSGSDESAPARSFWPELRLGGWVGHLAMQVARALLLMAALIAAFSVMFFFQRGSATSSPTHKLITGPAALLIPPLIATFVSIIGGQALLRARRTLLALPRGGLLLLLSPAVQFTAVLIVSGGIVWGTIAHAPAGLVLCCVVSLVALAFTYLTFVINLRAVQYWELLASGMLLAVPMGLASALMAIVGKAVILSNGIVASIAAVAGMILLASITWGVWSLRQSRRPYRPWPINAARWHAN